MCKFTAYVKQTCYLLLLLFVVGCGNTHDVESPLYRARVDGLNKESFRSRYSNPNLSIQYAQQALTFVEDSLPNYKDGRLRSWNNLAYAYYITSQHDSANAYVDSVMLCSNLSDNLKIEQVIAKLIKARLLQRNCQIAESYQILYDIDKSRILQHRNATFLYNFALSEYYITTLTLNYHYRNGSMNIASSSLSEIENQVRLLECDYNEDMALNYAIAHSYYRLCDDVDSGAVYLGKALNYIATNLELLSHPDRYEPYHLANCMQLLGSIGNNQFITTEAWNANYELIDYITEFLSEYYNFCVPDTVDYVDALYWQSTLLFFGENDPYQHIGAVAGGSSYSLSVGDTQTAYLYYDLILNDTTWYDGIAPKYEATIYSGLLLSGYSTDPALNREWHHRELELLEYIKQNEKADFLLQNALSRAKSKNLLYGLLFIASFVIAVSLIIFSIALRRKAKALKNETEQLQLAKRQDIERITNVETCLSVLRHDITPFMSYLQNKNLPVELRNEVIEQLIRTFNNIKNWTNLSIPTGLQFKDSVFPLQEVFDSTSQGVNNIHPDRVAVIFRPSTLEMHADRLLLEIMLRNLINNALQHTEQGSVTISAMEENEFAHIQVSDTGCGMTEEEIEYLFRTDKLRSSEGEHSGFGLILCRYIIKKHDDNIQRGCRIWAESEVGKGSVFHILIPLNKK